MCPDRNDDWDEKDGALRGLELIANKLVLALNKAVVPVWSPFRRGE